jgi:hypothetical protein
MGIVFFFLGGFFALYVVVKYNIDYARALKELENAFRMEGREWIYRRDVASRLSVFKTPESFVDAGDSAAVILAKGKILAVRKLMPRAIKTGILSLVIGTIAATVAGLVGLELFKKP